MAGACDRTRHAARRRALLGAALAAVIAPRPRTAAASAASAPIPVPVEQALPRARLAGEGQMRWFGLAVYDARLFVSGEGLDAARYARAAFALELRYARALAGEDIAQASLKEMTRLQFGTPAQRAEWLAAMRRLFPDVTPGERLTGIHRGDGTVRFLRNDVEIGRVDDRGFGEAFFGIWLDPRTREPQLRRALLQGLSSPPSS